MRDQVLRERRLDLAARIGPGVARVDVVARAAAPRRVRHDRDRRLDLAGGDQRVERALHLRPGALRVAAPVQEVENRIAVGRPLVSRRQVDVVGDRLVQRRRLEARLRQRSLGCGGACADGRRRQQDEQQRGAPLRVPSVSRFFMIPPFVGRVAVPYDWARATICRAAPSIAASTNSPPSSVPAARRLQPLDGRLGARDLLVGRQVRLLDHRQLVGMDRRAAEMAELAAAGARAGEAFGVADVRVDGLRRTRQAGGDGGVDDPAAGPVEPGLERARLGAQVGLAERDPRDARGASRSRTRPRARRPTRSGSAPDAAVDGHVLGTGDLRHDDPAHAGATATASRSSAVSRR